MKLSVVIPVYNERENVRRLYDALSPVLRALPHEHEILLVDDGSTDGSFEELERLAAIDGHVKVVRFRRNFGQTAAMNAGLHMASGDVVVTMDADLQNDPADIPLMLDKLAEGYDLVHGWRKNRQDAWVNRKLPSKIANWVISRVTGFPVHDLGCTLKTMRREVAQDLQLYGEMHRFIPILAHRAGAVRGSGYTAPSAAVRPVEVRHFADTARDARLDHGEVHDPVSDEPYAVVWQDRPGLNLGWIIGRSDDDRDEGCGRGRYDRQPVVVADGVCRVRGLAVHRAGDAGRVGRADVLRVAGENTVYDPGADQL